MSDNLLASLAFILAPLRFTKTTLAKKPIIAMTTKSSISVKPLFADIDSMSLADFDFVTISRIRGAILI